jgi:predicted PurR-regulated permease PerM
MSRPAAGGTTAIWIIAVVAAVLILRDASALLIPIVLGVLISYGLEPIVAWLEDHSIPRVLGSSLVLAAILGVSLWGAYSLSDDAAEALKTLPDALRRGRAIVWSQSQDGAGRQIRRTVEELGKTQTQLAQSAQSQPEATQSAATQPQAAQSLGEWARLGVGSAFTVAGDIMVIFFLVFFLLVSGRHFRQRILEVAGGTLERRRVTATIVDEISARIQRFLLVRLVTAAIVALATWAVLAWMGVAHAAVWGILAGAFNSIPYFGPILVSGGLLLVGLAQSGDIVQALWMSAAALAITSLEGWLLTPPLLGKTERMHVVVVFLGVLLWTWIWGAWGTLLAVPMLVVVKSVADHVESLKPIGRLMAP